MIKLAMLEPQVAVTDFLLTAECLLFDWLLLSQGTQWPEMRKLLVVFFASTALASLAGGTVHGFLPDATSAAGKWLWVLTMAALGAAAFSAWSIGAWLLFSPGVARWVQMAALAECAVYILGVFLVDQRFMVAVVNYVPAVIFLGVGFGYAYKSTHAGALLVALAGLAFTLAAAALQQGGLALHPKYFNHNATYHLVQGLALFLVFRGAMFLSASRPFSKIG